MGDTKKTVEFQGEEPMGDAAKYHTNAIVGFAQNIDPAALQKLGEAYEGIAENFGKALDTFMKNAQRLHAAWGGDDAAVEASRHFAVMYVAAQTMQANAKQIGGVLKNLASDKPDFSKTTFLVDGAYGVPTTSSIPNNEGTLGENRMMSLSQFKKLVTSNSDYFSGKDVDPYADGMKDTERGVYVYDPAGEYKDLGVYKETPTDQRGVYARYLLLQGNNGIFSTWQGIPQKVTLELPPKLTDTGGKPKDDGSGNNNNNNKTGASDPTATRYPAGMNMSKVPTGTPSPTGLPTTGSTNNPTGADLSGLNNPSGINKPGSTDLSGINNPAGTDLSGFPNPTGTPTLDGTSLNTPPGLGGTNLDPTTGSGRNTGLGSPYTPGSIKTPSLGGGGLGNIGSGLKTGSGATAENAAGVRGAVNTAATAAEEAAAGTAAANAAKAGGYMPMMPPMMGGQQGQSQDRERSAWLTEDEDIWGADDDVAPPLIG
jgi:hypothetical protein